MTKVLDYKMKKELIQQHVDIEDWVKEMLITCNRGISALKDVTELKDLKYEMDRFQSLMHQDMNQIEQSFFVVEEIMKEIK